MTRPNYTLFAPSGSKSRFMVPIAPTSWLLYGRSAASMTNGTSQRRPSHVTRTRWPLRRSNSATIVRRSRLCSPPTQRNCGNSARTRKPTNSKDVPPNFKAPPWHRLLKGEEKSIERWLVHAPKLVTFRMGLRAAVLELERPLHRLKIHFSNIWIRILLAIMPQAGIKDASVAIHLGPRNRIVLVRMDSVIEIAAADSAAPAPTTRVCGGRRLLRIPICLNLRCTHIARRLRRHGGL